MAKTVGPPRPPSAWQIAEAMSALTRAAQELLAAEPDLPETDPKLWQDMLEGQTEGADPYAIIDTLVQAAIAAADTADMIRRRKNELGARQARLERREEHLRLHTRTIMDALDLRRLERPEYTASVAPGQPHVVLTGPVDELPEKYLRVHVEPDKQELRRALMQGEHVLGAELSNPVPSLRITRS
jgi:hypothetical protein